MQPGISQNDFQKKRVTLEKKLKAETISIGHRFKIQEFPTSTATALDFENKILQLKSQGWTPDVIFVDYLTIMRPLNKVSSQKGYESGVMVAEELRGLSGKMKIPVISAIQSNRSEGANTSNVDVNNVSESYGIVSTCDFLGALFQTEEDKGYRKHLFQNIKK